MEDDTFVNKFSVPTPGNPQMYSRAFVSHRGGNTGSGLWSCSKDPAITRCVHISRARDKLQQLLQRNPEAKDAHSGEGDTGSEATAIGLEDIDCNGTKKFDFNVIINQTDLRHRYHCWYSKGRKI